LNNIKTFANELDFKEPRTIFNQANFLDKKSKYRIKSITIYGNDFVSAVAMEFINKSTAMGKNILAKGSNFIGMHEKSK